MEVLNIITSGFTVRNQVGPGYRAQDQVFGPGMAHVYGDAVFVRVVVGEIAAAVYSLNPVLEWSGPPQNLRSFGGLYAHHRGAVLTQIFGDHWPGDHPAKIENFQAIHGLSVCRYCSH